MDNKQPWQKKILKSIQMAYSKAPQFNSIFPIFEELLQQPCELLSELNSKIIVEILNENFELQGNRRYVIDSAKI